MAAGSELRASGFYYFWTAQTVAMVGSVTSVFALPLIAVITLDANAWWMGVLAASSQAAALVFGLSIGVWADRFEHLKLMYLANACRVVLVLSVPILWAFDMLTMGFLVVVAFLIGALTLLYEAAMVPFLPRLLSNGRELGRANSWVEASESTGDVAGPGFAGLLVQAVGAPLAMLMDAASYVVSSVLLTRVPKVAPRKPPEEQESHLDAIKGGMRAMRRFPHQLPLALASAQFNFFGSMFGALIILYCVRDIGMNAGTLGLLSMLGGVGGLVAAGVGQRLTRRLGVGRTLTLCYFAPCLTALPIGLVTEDTFAVALLVVGLSQFFWPFWIVIMRVNAVTLRQTLVPNNYLARVGTISRFLSMGVMPVGALLAGALGSSALGVRGTLILSSAGLASAALWPLLSPLWRLRDMPEPGNGEDGAEGEDRGPDPDGRGADDDGPGPEGPSHAAEQGLRG